MLSKKLILDINNDVIITMNKSQHAIESLRENIIYGIMAYVMEILYIKYSLN